MRSCGETFIDPTIVTLEKLLIPQPLLGTRDAMFIQFLVGRARVTLKWGQVN